MAVGDKSIRGDARTVRNREKLRAALLSLLEHHSFDDLTVRQITAEAGVGYATFFRHYPTKGAALDDLATCEIDSMVDRSLEALDYADTRKASLALCTYVDEHRAVWSALFNGGAASVMRQEYIRLSVVNTEIQPHRSEWLPNDIAGIHNAGASLEILAWWLRQGDAVSIAQVAEIVDKLVIAPVLAASSLHTTAAE